MVDRHAAHAQHGKGQHVIPAQPDDARDLSLRYLRVYLRVRESRKNIVNERGWPRGGLPVYKRADVGPLGVKG